jgi:hypothetical protein
MAVIGWLILLTETKPQTVIEAWPISLLVCSALSEMDVEDSLIWM